MPVRKKQEKVDDHTEESKARCTEDLANCTGRADVERCRLDAMPIGLSLAGCHSLEGSRAPGTARRRPRADGPSILLFQDCSEEHCQALPVNGENVHLCLSKVEKLFFDRPDDHRRDRLTKSANPQTLSGHSLHNDRGRPVLGKSSIL